MSSEIEVGGPPKGSVVGVKYPYKYPRGLDLRPGHKFHDDILHKIRELLMESHRIISRRYDSWNKIDETLTTYIPTSELEKKEKAKDPRKPISVVVPKSLAMLDTLQANYVATFLERPYFRYKGYGVEDTLKALLLQQVIDFQCVKNKVALKLMTMWRDGFAYGLGVTTPVWVKKYGKSQPLKKVVRVERQDEPNDVRRLKDRVRQLEAALADVVMDQALDQAFFGILCDRTGTDAMEFKKKHVGTARTRPTRRYEVTEE